MNFLAHALLAGTQPADRVGGVIGDFVKGRLEPLPPGLSPALAAGVMLHRRIDSYADRHPAFQRSRARISAERRRVSGIMVDMFYDHFLARHWARFSAQALEAFAADTYALLGSFPEPLPAAFMPMFQAMAADDWFAGYREPQRIAGALDAMAHRRLRRPNALAGAGAELLRDYAGFEADCLEFLPDARAYAAALIAAR